MADIQVKLLTLLNVSAVKRPGETDLPGAHAKFPVRSKARFASASVSASASASAEPGSLGEGDASASASALGSNDAEPPRKKKKTVQWNGEIGPSGSRRAGGGGKGKTAETAVAAAPSAPVALRAEESSEGALLAEDRDDEEEGAAGTSSLVPDTFNEHFGITPAILSADAVQAAEDGSWDVTRRREISGLGRVVESRPRVKTGKGTANGNAEDAVEPVNRITPALLSQFNAFHPRQSPTLSATLNILGQYADLYAHGLDGDGDGTGAGGFGPQTEAVRSAIGLHLMNHVLKTRRKIIRNNEKLAHGTTDPSLDPRDQSFTRPKILLLVPFRSLALHYLTTHIFPLAPPGTQIENRQPLAHHFSLGGADDPLDVARDPTLAEKYAPDHLATFRGNSDDNFRLGIKITRKAWRAILPPAGEDKLIDCDILIASPLAIRMAAEKERSTDTLSSIEVCIADGLDVMAMQNWEHVQYVFEHMNQIPIQPHGCDFSRAKPWYSDNQSRFLRQTVLLSRFETPEFRSLYNHHLCNVQGKFRIEQAAFPGVLDRVRKGVRQVFTRIDAGDAVAELDVRFKHFAEETFPALLKSAISRTNTIIVVPSYFDFVRVTDFLRDKEDVEYAAISEYSSSQEISRARTSFFKGKKAFLVVTERFHFYRRYRLRGARTLVFYALPDHASYYAEFMQGPFLPSATGKQTMDVDEAEVSSRVAFSKFDYLKLERIVGTADARRMVTGEDTKYTFI